MKMKELIAKATEGTLLPAELEHVVQELRNNPSDPYRALLIVGRAGAVQYRDIVESYLDSSHDPMLARLALLIICDYWNLTSQYKDVLERFVRGAEWDVDNDVRLVAISACGRLLAVQSDDRLLKLLLRIFRDCSESKPQILRETAYKALAVASGKSDSELPPASRHFDLERDLNQDVLDYIDLAEQRLAL
jgi:hypothetical protein